MACPRAPTTDGPPEPRGQTRRLNACLAAIEIRDAIEPSTGAIPRASNCPRASASTRARSAWVRSAASCRPWESRQRRVADRRAEQASGDAAPRLGERVVQDQETRLRAASASSSCAGKSDEVEIVEILGERGASPRGRTERLRERFAEGLDSSSRAELARGRRVFRQLARGLSCRWSRLCTTGTSATAHAAAPPSR